MVVKVRKAVKYDLSRNGRVCRIMFDDGTVERISLENALRCFNNYRKAVIEYCTYVWMKMNNAALANEVVDEIKKLM
jgi:hypothetical protein